MREEMVQEPALPRVGCLLGSPALTPQHVLGEDWLSTCPPCLSGLGRNYLLCLSYTSALSPPPPHFFKASEFR